MVGRKAVVIGASSGIGRALARVLAQNGYTVGLAARRTELLRQLQKELSTQTYVKHIDVCQTEQAMSRLQELIDEMGGMDLFVLSSGINPYNTNLAWREEIATIDVNVCGFVACINVAVRHFLTQNCGHIVGISSIACLRGNASSPAYSASKAFVSNYLEGLRHKLSRKHIYVTDIRPGLVDTDLIRGRENLFWVATPEDAAKQIFQAIKRKKKVAYIPGRWRIVAWLMQVVPERIYCLRYKDRDHG